MCHMGCVHLVLERLTDGLRVCSAPRRPHRGATIASPRSGRALDVLTTTPGLRLYMGQRLGGAPGKNGTAYGPHAGITVVAQARCMPLCGVRGMGICPLPQR